MAGCLMNDLYIGSLRSVAAAHFDGLAGKPADVIGKAQHIVLPDHLIAHVVDVVLIGISRNAGILPEDIEDLEPKHASFVMEDLLGNSRIPYQRAAVVSRWQAVAMDVL